MEKFSNLGNGFGGLLEGIKREMEKTQLAPTMEYRAFSLMEKPQQGEAVVTN